MRNRKRSRQQFCRNPKCMHMRKTHKMGRYGACKVDGCECDHYWTDSEAKWVMRRVIEKLQGVDDSRTDMGYQIGRTVIGRYTAKSNMK